MKKICSVIYGFIVVFFAGQGYAGEPLQPMTIQLNWIPNVQFAGVLLAKERGWYEEQGIDLSIKGWEPGISPIDEVIEGKAQIGVAEGDVLVRSRVDGTTIKAIAVQFQKSPFCLLSKTSQQITVPIQLVGKKIGIPIPEEELIVKIMLENQGLKFEDIIPVKVGWDLQPLIDDEIDVFVAFMNDQPLFLKQQGYEVTYIPAFKYGYNFYSGVYFVTEAMLQEQPELIQTFLEVTLQGWQEAFKDPAAAAQLVVAQYFPDGLVSQQTESLKLFRMLATLGEGKKFLGWMGEEVWAQGVDILYKFEQINQKTPVEDLFTMELLRSIYFGDK